MGGKTDKITVLPQFVKTECGGGSSCVPLSYNDLTWLGSEQGCSVVPDLSKKFTPHS